jgi:hypothetical protein
MIRWKKDNGAKFTERKGNPKQRQHRAMTSVDRGLKCHQKITFLKRAQTSCTKKMFTLLISRCNVRADSIYKTCKGSAFMPLPSFLSLFVSYVFTVYLTTLWNVG